MKEEDKQAKISTNHILKQIHAYKYNTIKILPHASGPGY